MRIVPSKLLFRCFLRSYLVNAAYNPRGLQNIGFIFAFEPALEFLYGPGERLAEARMRYARHHNCHPFFTPMLLGVLLRLETGIANGVLPPSVLEGLKDTTANTLSAIGDSFFNGTLLVTWALVSSCLILAGLPEKALWFTVQCFVFLQVFKLLSYVLGFRKGMDVLFLLRRFDLINWCDRFKCVNAVLLGLFLWLGLPGAPMAVWAGVAFYLLFMGWLVGRRHISRVFVALVLLTITVTLHLTGWFEHIPARLPW
jgi:PTS system mannose-specific IID component